MTSNHILVLVLLATLMPAPLEAQAATYRTEPVTYLNAEDGTELSATLAMPAARGPHPAVVVLSVAGTDPLVDHLVGEGYAVLTPTLRGFVAVEPLLQATYSDLAGDVRQALDYLASREEVDGAALGLIAQADNGAPAMLVAASEGSVPLVLLAPPAFPGPEELRLEQRWIAERASAGAGELEALDRYVAGIAEIVLGETAPYAREYRLRGLRAGSRVDLPPNAAFPSDEGQARFFASPLWHDRLAFEPETAFARLRSPVLVLIGTDDSRAPMDEYLSSVRRALAAGAHPDAIVCRIPGRTRHTFSVEGVSAIAEWLGERVGAGSGTREAGGRSPSACLGDDETG